MEWAAFALDQADQAAAYISQFNERAALDLLSRFEDVSLLLSNQPYSGRAGRLDGTREYVAHPNYILIYTVLSDRILIENVVHARREYP